MAPEWTASFGINYDATLNNGMGWGIAVDGLYSDEYNASALGHPYAWRDSYTLWNASVYLAGAEDRWQVQLLGKNLGDEMGDFRDAGGGIQRCRPVSGGPHRDMANLPRTVALQFTLNFR